MIRHVQQKHNDGCGPAVIAMLTDISYESALSAVHPLRDPICGYWSTEHDLRPALEKLSGWCLAPASPRVRVVDWTGNVFRDLSTAVIGVSLGGCVGHWILWDAEARRIHDPNLPHAERAGVAAKRLRSNKFDSISVMIVQPPRVP